MEAYAISVTAGATLCHAASITRFGLDASAHTAQPIMEEETKSFQHEDYDLLCGAKTLDRGRFAPTLFVSKQSWPRRRRQIALAPGDFPSTHTAINAAFT